MKAKTLGKRGWSHSGKHVRSCSGRCSNPYERPLSHLDHKIHHLQSLFAGSETLSLGSKLAFGAVVSAFALSTTGLEQCFKTQWCLVHLICDGEIRYRAAALGLAQLCP